MRRVFLGEERSLLGEVIRGKGPLRNSLSTSMDAESCIFADAKTEGNGGRVILWSDGNTLFNGKIYTRGGEKGGNGGFVEEPPAGKILVV